MAKKRTPSKPKRKWTPPPFRQARCPHCRAVQIPVAYSRTGILVLGPSDFIGEKFIGQLDCGNCDMTLQISTPLTFPQLARQDPDFPQFRALWETLMGHERGNEIDDMAQVSDITPWVRAYQFWVAGFDFGVERQSDLDHQDD